MKSKKNEEKEKPTTRVGCYSVRFALPGPGWCSLDLDVFTKDPEEWLRGARMLCALEEDFICCREKSCWICLGQDNLPNHGHLDGRTFTYDASPTRTHHKL